MSSIATRRLECFRNRDSQCIEVDIPEIEAFTGPKVFNEVFDQYERRVLEARNGVVEEATEKYLSELAQKKPGLRRKSEK